jgi:Lrp/AsnC family transcriptional regulator, leucine-responsive regulatory protein
MGNGTHSQKFLKISIIWENFQLVYININISLRKVNFMKMTLDELDFLLLEQLTRDSNIPLQKLSALFNQPKSTIHNRIKRLENSNTISNYLVKVNFDNLGYNLLSYVMITYEKNPENYDQEQVALMIREIPQVEEVSLIAGEFDILIKVRFQSIQQLSDFSVKKLKSIPGVAKTISHVVLKEIKTQYDEPNIFDDMKRIEV